MAFDAHKNFAYSTVATAPSPASSGTSLVVASGGGTKFPAVPFNATVWPAGSQPTAANAEIVRVTGIGTDTFTITRTQESTSARAIVVGDQIAATITAKTLTDVESAVGCLVRRTTSQTISNNTDTNVLWDVEDAATSGTHSTSVNPERLIAPVAGWYHAFASVRWATAAATIHVLEIRKNGSSTVSGRTASTIYPAPGNEASANVSTVVKLAANDYVTISVYQNSGSNLAIDATSVQQPTAGLVLLGT